MFGFLELKTILLIVHIFGAIVGAGGAFTSDWIFLSSIKDSTINETEIRFIELGSRMVWIGLIILIISGLALFSLAPEQYLASGKFLAKMSIVGILTLNGLLFHLVYIPLFGRNLNSPIPLSVDFKHKSTFIMISGAISMISWSSAIILGVIKKIPYGYKEIMSVYLLIVLFGIISAIFMKKRTLHL